jgi:hypothetical protein
MMYENRASVARRDVVASGTRDTRIDTHVLFLRAQWSTLAFAVFLTTHARTMESGA